MPLRFRKKTILCVFWSIAFKKTHFEVFLVHHVLGHCVLEIRHFYVFSGYCVLEEQIF
ncbi:hypothetical protein Hanom_Chr03g00242891 [Helianthus anomalus]